jgi:plastocyanin
MSTSPYLASIALLAAAGPVQLAAAPAAPQYNVTVDSFAFAPKPIRLVAGTPVTLTFVNRSGSSHDFTARKFFASARIIAGAASDGEIDLPPHATKSVTLIPARGTYKAHCGHFGHSVLGMKDKIMVQ